MSRRSKLELEHAMMTARQMKESHLGEVLLKDNVAEQRLLCGHLTKLNRELRRHEAHFKQQRSKFLKHTSDLPDPILIVERSPTIDQLQKAMNTSDEDMTSGGHGYMRPTQRRVRSSPVIPTIDAYSVKPRRKQNIWEEAMAATEKHNFHSTVIPSEPLTKEEKKELQRGFVLHQKPGSLARGLDMSLPGTPKRGREGRRAKLILPDTMQAILTEDQQETTSSPFITQLQLSDNEEPHQSREGGSPSLNEQNVTCSKTVAFDPVIKCEDDVKKKDMSRPVTQRRRKKGRSYTTNV